MAESGTASASSTKKVTDFLRSRGIFERVIQKFEMEKMDAEAVAAADDDTLRSMGIATKGDMLALRAFCVKKSDLKNEEKEKGEREKRKAELSLFLKEKRYHPSTSGSRNIKKRTGGPGKSKEERKRRIEIGWLHRSSSDDRFVVMRSKDGGGTRTAEMSGTSGKMDIICYAKNLFFPNGRNSLFSEDDVLFGLGNFSQEEIASTVVFPNGSVQPFNVENYCQSTKLTKLRLYLTTTLMADFSECDDQNGDVPKSNGQELKSLAYFVPNEASLSLDCGVDTVINIPDTAESPPDQVLAEFQFDTRRSPRPPRTLKPPERYTPSDYDTRSRLVVTEEPICVDECVTTRHALQDSSFEPSVALMEGEPSLNPFNLDEVLAISTDDNNQGAYSLPNQQLGTPTRILEIHRLNVRNDMINIFSDPSILVLSNCIEVVFIDQKGDKEEGRGSGLLRDAFSLFWSDAYDSLMLGEHERVPCIRHDFQRLEWEAIGKILVAGYLSCQYFPLLLSKSFIAYCLYGESVITPDMLLQSFNNYVSETEREVIEKCRGGEFDDNSEQLMDVLSSFDCKKSVSKENASQILTEIAHKEIIQRPQYVAECWKDIINYLKPSFPSLAALDELYDRLVPSVGKVIQRIKSQPNSDGERESLKHLKRYIRGLDPMKLGRFLRFVSGSELLLFPELHITFSQLEGNLRRPVAHTCTFVLELPSTYQSFPELREEFNNILSLNSWEMNVV